MNLFYLFIILNQDSLKNYFDEKSGVTSDLFFSLENPLLLAILFFSFLLLLTYVYIKHIYLPKEKDHKKEKEQLKEQQTKLMALFAELSPDPVIRFDKNGKIIICNEAASKSFGIGQLTDKNIFDILPRLKNLDTGKAVRENRRVILSETVNGRFFQFIVAGIDDIKSLQLYGRDITELVTKEEELKKALKKAEAADAVKEEFFRTISHEIRSPLVTIQGYAEMLEEELNSVIPEEYKYMFKAIENNSKRLYRTIDLLVNISEISAGKYEPDHRALNLAEILQSHYSNFVSFAEEKDVELKYENRGNKTVVIADLYSLDQIIANLLDNAFKYTESGEVMILLEEEDEYARVDICDTGIGMSDEYVEKIFDYFSQESSGYSRVFEGTGLGMSLVKRYLEINNAHLKIKSEKNKGTVISLFLKKN